MYKQRMLSPSIEVCLEPGIYVTDRESATGKTYLCNLLKKYRMIGEPVAGYSYMDFQMGSPIESVLIPGKFKVILLDRYDQYKGAGKQLINECAKESVIIIDCKSALTICDSEKLCEITLQEGGIFVD